MKFEGGRCDPVRIWRSFHLRSRIWVSEALERSGSRVDSLVSQN